MLRVCGGGFPDERLAPEGLLNEHFICGAARIWAFPLLCGIFGLLTEWCSSSAHISGQFARMSHDISLDSNSWHGLAKFFKYPPITCFDTYLISLAVSLFLLVLLHLYPSLISTVLYNHHHLLLVHLLLVHLKIPRSESQRTNTI